ncbi:MAG TPA: HepT-like ribonuclease domain-containing protein [Devosia sp.]
MSDDRIASHLDAIYEAALKAPRMVAGLSKAQFLSDEKSQMASVMTLIIVGEAAARIMQRSPEYIAAHPEVPWEKIRALRNRGVHGYDSLDFEVIWDVLTEDLPVLLNQIAGLLDEFGGPLPPPHTGT